MAPVPDSRAAFPATLLRVIPRQAGGSQQRTPSHRCSDPHPARRARDVQPPGPLRPAASPQDDRSQSPCGPVSPGGSGREPPSASGREPDQSGAPLLLDPQNACPQGRAVPEGPLRCASPIHLRSEGKANHVLKSHPTHRQSRWGLESLWEAFMLTLLYCVPNAAPGVL